MKSLNSMSESVKTDIFVENISIVKNGQKIFLDDIDNGLLECTILDIINITSDDKCFK